MYCSSTTPLILVYLHGAKDLALMSEHTASLTIVGARPLQLEQCPGQQTLACKCRMAAKEALGAINSSSIVPTYNNSRRSHLWGAPFLDIMHV